MTISGCLMTLTFKSLHGQKNQPVISPDCSHKQTFDLFHDFIDDFSFAQMVKEPTMYKNLFLATNPTLVKRVAFLPGLNDLNMAIAIAQGTG